MNTLHIDTRDNKQMIIRITTKNGTFEEKSKANVNGAQTILPQILKVLKKSKLKPKEIEEINVERGPGSYTGVRVGVSIANALGFGLNIKVNGKNIGEIELPQY